MRPRKALEIGVVMTMFLLLETAIGGPQSEDGFLGVLWGTRLDSLKTRFELVLTTADGACDRYSTNIRRVGNSEIDECDFEFIGGKLSGAALLTRGAENSHALLAYLELVFGKGHRDQPGSYQWLTKRVHLFYDEDSGGDGYIYWYCRECQSAGDSAASGPRKARGPHGFKKPLPSERIDWL
jgi:hypothetical protein